MFLEQTINGLALGSVYALIAVGYSLIFGILRILNLAHSTFYAFAANILLLLISSYVGLIPALIIVVLLTGLLASSFDKFLLEPLRGRQASSTISLITAIGFSYVVENLMIAFFGSERRPFPNIFGTTVFKFAGVNVQISQIYLLLISVILLVTLTLIVYKTKLGLGMRASEQNAKAANLMGVNVNRTITITFFLSGIYAALAGFLISGYYMVVYPTMGVTIGTKAFVAAVLGGIGVLHGSVVGGLLIGILECYAVALWGANVRDAVAFVILIVVLMFAPAGIFGKKEVTKI